MMKQKQSTKSFSPARAEEILGLAAKYYAEEQESYTGKELYEAGIEANIPDRLIQKAIQDLQRQQEQKLAQRRRVKHCLKFALGISSIAISAIAFWTAGTYNHLTATKLEAETALKQVENQLQRRAALIPQLVSLTKSYSDRQSKIITQLIQARQVYLDADILDEKITAIAKLDRAIQDFTSYAATNHQLNSSQLFVNLQYEITGTENRLAVERRRHDQAVQKYNQEIQQFPQSLAAQIFGFESWSR